MYDRSNILCFFLQICKLYLDIFEVGFDFQDVDQSNKKSLMNLKYFPEHSEELNLTASLETNKKLDASGRTEM